MKPRAGNAPMRLKLRTGNVLLNSQFNMSVCWHSLGLMNKLGTGLLLVLVEVDIGVTPNTVIEFRTVQTIGCTVMHLRISTVSFVLSPHVLPVSLPTPINPMHVATLSADGLHLEGELRQPDLGVTSGLQQLEGRDAHNSPDLIGFDPP